MSEIFKGSDTKLQVVLSFFTYLPILGLVVMGVSFFGCCGAIREHQCMTLTYAGLLLFLIAAQIIAGIVVFVSRTSVRMELVTYVEKTFERHDLKEIEKIQEKVSLKP